MYLTSKKRIVFTLLFCGVMTVTPLVGLVDVLVHGDRGDIAMSVFTLGFAAYFWIDFRKLYQRRFYHKEYEDAKRALMSALVAFELARGKFRHFQSGAHSVYVVRPHRRLLFTSDFIITIGEADLTDDEGTSDRLAVFSEDYYVVRKSFFFVKKWHEVSLHEIGHDGRVGNKVELDDSLGKTGIAGFTQWFKATRGLSEDLFYASPDNLHELRTLLVEAQASSPHNEAR